MKLPPLQARLLRNLRRRNSIDILNLAPRTAILRTARALERCGLVTITPNRQLGGFNIYLAT